MDFESPGSEKNFPGLYSLEVTRKKDESDFSDDSHDKSYRSDLIGKRKDKKDSKKDRGYAALEGESSQDETESKSPSKSKKTKSFKFPVKKSEKREKSREKETRDREKDIEKDKKKEKDKKEKSKPKEKKKIKQLDDGVAIDEHAVFGVPLAKAIERLGCLDGVGIPLPVRHCIDCIHAAGLSNEGLYKTPGIKTKLQMFKKCYNLREPVSSLEMDVPLAASLLITFLKELPDHILTAELTTRFEEAGAVQDVAQREEELANLLSQLPECNRTLLSWLIVHFDQVTLREKQNKINAQSIAMTFSPVLQMSHRLLTAFLCHCKTLFTDTVIQRYVPPLAPGSRFPEELAELAGELRKQEALLNQLHQDMNEGFVSKNREEQLWEVQRIVTQLKRKLKSLQKPQEASQKEKSLGENVTVRDKKLTKEKEDQQIGHEAKPVVKASSSSPKGEVALKPQPDTNFNVSKTHEGLKTVDSEKEHCVQSRDATPSPPSYITHHVLSSELFKVMSETEIRLQLENIQLHQLHAQLQDRLDRERLLAEKIKAQIETYRGFIDSDSDESSAESTPAYLSPETEAKLELLIEENQQLCVKKEDLVRKIMEEREACMKLSLNIDYIELKNKDICSES